MSALLSIAEKDVINTTRILFGKNAKDVKEFFESMGIYAVLSYAKGDKIVIPFIGEINIKHGKEELIDNRQINKLESQFTPSEFLARNIEQVQAKISTDAEKILISRFQSVFKEKLKE